MRLPGFTANEVLRNFEGHTKALVPRGKLRAEGSFPSRVSVAM